MIKYYNRYYILILIFRPNDKIYLDSAYIYTICLSVKLVYWYLGLYIVEKQVLISYRLKLFLFMRRLYSVFNIVKLTNTFEDPILG